MPFVGARGWSRFPYFYPIRAMAAVFTRCGALLHRLSQKYLRQEEPRVPVACFTVAKTYGRLFCQILYSASDRRRLNTARASAALRFPLALSILRGLFLRGALLFRRSFVYHQFPQHWAPTCFCGQTIVSFMFLTLLIIPFLKRIKQPRTGRHTPIEFWNYQKIINKI